MTADQITKEVVATQAQFKEAEGQIKNISDFAGKLQEMEGQEITEVFTFLLLAGVVLNSSDIHIESEEEGARVRIRIDGVLHEVTSIPHSLYTSLLSR
ncbi:MAG: hypothetical protein QF775_04240, partial [archaeon]|nr:hypothetical protein [archaeon]